jgi:xanthine dehydrogenase YagR molybdenum-binding subunit
MAASNTSVPNSGAWSVRHIGVPTSRVDGLAKVTGTAKYAAEFVTADLLYGCVVSSSIAKGRIETLDAESARAVPGVVEVFTHENRPHIAWFDRSYADEDAPPGSPFRPLRNAEIVYSGQPIALVIARDFETARFAASLVEARYAPAEHATDLQREREHAFRPKRKKSGSQAPPTRGDTEAGFAEAEVRHRAEYRIAIEHHNPMELHAATVVWEGDGKITVHDKTQGPMNTHDYVCGVFGFNKNDVRVEAPFVGGAFGSGLRPQYQLFLAVMAAKALERSVRVVLSREQMFTFGYRPDALQTIELGARADGTLTAIKHDAIQNTSQFENYSETIVNWSGLLYACPNAALDHRLVRLDLYTPIDMRAPGAATGVNVFEAAIDELAYELRMDPLEFRRKNYAETDQNENKPFTSKELRECYSQGAERFGWSQRSLEPRSMRDGRELVGWGMASGVWEANQMKAQARATLSSDGRLEVASATSDIGTGTYTILAQIAADTFGLALEDVAVKLGDSTLPKAPLEGGSWTAASVGSAVQAACEALKTAVLKQAHTLGNSPLGKARASSVTFERGEVILKRDARKRLTLREIVLSSGNSTMTVEAAASPSLIGQRRRASYTHSAVFVEVKVDEELGQIRVTRIVSAIAAGRILNPKTARSQIIGGIVFGMGMVLHEESMLDHTLGRFMNHNYAEYHIPVNADVHNIDVIFVDEKDEHINPLGVKGVGEIGVVGTAAAIANAIFHATGKRIRELPITLDKLL